LVISVVVLFEVGKSSWGSDGLSCGLASWGSLSGSRLEEIPGT
jgi:hypothetical protein